MFKIIMFYYENAWIYVRVGILLTVGKLLLDRIIVHREDGCVLNLVQPSHLLFIWPAPSLKSEQSFICVLDVLTLPLNTIFGNCSNSVVFSL